jgi:Vitamin B6 photo-protection and homoeostasis
MFKAICGVAAGAVNGVFNLHWARGSDIADIQAKSGAQHTVTGSLGLLFSYCFVQSIAKVKPSHVWSIYIALTILHLYANMMCMRIIAFDYLNTPRMRILVHQFLEQWNNSDDESPLLMDPVKLARKEPLLFGVPYTQERSPVTILFGESFESHRQKTLEGNEIIATNHFPGSLSESLKDQKYLISSVSKGKKHRIVVSLAAQATARDKTRAYLHAMILGRTLQDSEPEVLATALMETAWTSFERACSRVGWDLDRTELHSMGYELSLVE